MIKVVLIFTLVACSFSVIANEMYRASSSGDRGTYYIINSEKGNDGILIVLSSRIGKGNLYTDFTKLKVNCETKQYFELGGSSEDGAKRIPSKPLQDWPNSRWTSLVAGSSKSDLVQHVCHKHK